MSTVVKVLIVKLLSVLKIYTSFFFHFVLVVIAHWILDSVVMFYIRGSKFLILTISTLKHTTNTSQEPLTDQSVGQVEAGQGEREADEVQTEQENH